MTAGLELLVAAGIDRVLEQLRELEADVLVFDAPLSAADLLAALAHARKLAPRARILVLSSPESLEFGELCLCVGASGYLSKDIDLRALARIIGGLGRGEAVVSRTVATGLIARLRSAGRRGPAPRRRALTGPEARLLQLLRAGLTVENAAAELGLAEPIAHRHLTRARRKLLADAAESGVRTTTGTHPTTPIEEP